MQEMPFKRPKLKKIPGGVTPPLEPPPNSYLQHSAHTLGSRILFYCGGRGEK
jgi:hypothetical protein